MDIAPQIDINSIIAQSHISNYIPPVYPIEVPTFKFQI